MFQFRQARSIFFLLAATIFCSARSPATAENLGVLGSSPKWSVLAKYDRTITRDDFTNLVQTVYCTHGMADDLIAIGDDSARILVNREATKYFTLHFAPDEKSSEPVPRLWKPAASLTRAKPEKP